MTHPSLQAAEVLSLRHRLGWSEEKLAEVVGSSVRAVRAWEAGRRVPARYARRMEYYGALTDREAALERAGLPKCKWAAEWGETPLPDDDAELLASFDELEAHERTCPDCLARERYAARHLPPLPVPPWRSRWDYFSRLPLRARYFPILYVAIFALLVGGAVFLDRLGSSGEWADLLDGAEMFLIEVAVAMVVGGIGALIAHFAHTRRTRRT